MSVFDQVFRQQVRFAVDHFVSNLYVVYLELSPRVCV
jgi:hypothetical protein